MIRAASKGTLGEIGKGQRPLTDVELELARVKKELGTGQDGAGHPKKGRSVLCEGVTARYALMKDLRLEYPLKLMAQLFDVSTSGFYRWLKKKPSQREQNEPRLRLEVKAAHKRDTRDTSRFYVASRNPKPVNMGSVPSFPS